MHELQKRRKKPSFELAALYFSIASLLIATGPEQFSLDRKLFGPC